MNSKFKSLIVIVGIALAVLLVFGSMIFLTLEPGEKGVIFRKFSGGLDKENVYNAGFHVIAPWNTMFVYDVKEQKVDETMDVLDKNGLSVHVDISVRFFPTYEKIGELHEKFGVSYVQKLVVPEVRSMVRQVMGRFTAEEIYSTKRKEVEEQIINETRDVLKLPQNNIKMTALLIRSIILPPNIKNAIESKLKQEQEFLAYQYKLKKAESEAKKKKIDAEGEATANKIVSSSLTDNLLKMRGIEATLKLSKSPNTKIVVVGSGKDGLPMILGGN
ncbi:MAG: prohibitin family protein [Bacteroidota bacterium]|nr:prohibitin family protein [Bacteroidota bacterium]